MSDPSKQLDLFPTSEPEIQGQLVAFAVMLRGLIEALIANGALTEEQTKTLLSHSDIKRRSQSGTRRQTAYRTTN